MKKAFIATTSFLLAVILVLGVYAFKTTTSLTVTSASLENLYQRSFYELTSNVNNMEVEVSKLLVTNDSSSQQKILSNLKQQTSDAMGSLSLLPVNSNVVASTSKFMNQLGGYCSSLITYKDGKIDTQDFANLEKIHASIAQIKDELNTTMEKLMNGYRIVDNLENGENDSQFSLNFAYLNNDTIELPSLIYDGPFSDSTTQQTIKGLPQTEVSKDDAELKVQSLFGDSITNLVYLGETKSAVETFDFGLSANGKNYFIQITKRGGFLLTMSANALEDAAQENQTSSQAEENSTDVEQSEVATVKKEDVNSTKNGKAIDVALEFAKKLDIKNLKSVWSAASNGVCYVNLAPVQDDIILYPDLIKAKVDLSSNQVIGWEASSYAFNHVEREDLIPQLSKEEAKKLVSNNLTIDNQQLCVIPLDFVGETLAYEFSGTFDDYQYYLYIDAYTGNQVRVLRVIQTDQGDLVL